MRQNVNELGVNYLWKALENRVGLQLIDDLAKKLNITKDDYQGQTFEGNACKTILANTDNMRIFLEVNHKEEFVPFIDTFEAFEEVVQTCFGVEYNEQYEEKIDFF